MADECAKHRFIHPNPNPMTRSAIQDMFFLKGVSPKYAQYIICRGLKSNGNHVGISSRLWCVLENGKHAARSFLPIASWINVIWTTLLRKPMSKVRILTILRETSTSNQKIHYFNQAVHTRQDCDMNLTQTAQEEEEVTDVCQAHTACKHKSKYTWRHFLASTTTYI